MAKTLYKIRHHKTPRREHRQIFSDINHSNGFLGQSPKAKEIKAKLHNWDLIKLKSFCTGSYQQNKRTTYRMGENICKPCKRQGINLQNTQTAHATQYQKNKQSNQNLGRRHFSIEDIQMASRYMIRCSILLIMREIQIKTTMKYHLSPVKMIIIK